MTPAAIVARRIKTLRHERGISLREMASRLGCARKNVMRFERGTHVFLLDTLVHIAAALGVRVADLLEGVDAGRGVTLDDCRTHVSRIKVRAA